jgi:hypothetical protein
MRPGGALAAVLAGSRGSRQRGQRGAHPASGAAAACARGRLSRRRWEADAPRQDRGSPSGRFASRGGGAHAGWARGSAPAHALRSCSAPPTASAEAGKSSQNRSRAATGLPARLTGEGALIDSDRRKGPKSKEVSSSGFQLREWLRREAEAWLTDPGRPGIPPAWGWARAENACALLSPVSSSGSAMPVKHPAPTADMRPQLGRAGRSRATRIFDRGGFGTGTRLAAGERMVPRGPLNGGRAR